MTAAAIQFLFVDYNILKSCCITAQADASCKSVPCSSPVASPGFCTRRSTTCVFMKSGRNHRNLYINIKKPTLSQLKGL